MGGVPLNYHGCLNMSCHPGYYPTGKGYPKALISRLIFFIPNLKDHVFNQPPREFATKKGQRKQR